MIRHLYLVSDKFADFAVDGKAILYSDLVKALSNNSLNEDVISISRGQGLSNEQMEEIFALARHNNQEILFYDSPKNIMCDRSLVHKVRPENSLLTVPQRKSEKEFSANILIDERNELMQDHTTGKHVQGMLLVEAARQLVLAVTELFYLDKNEGTHSFVWKGMEFEFVGYAFPLPMEAICTLCSFNKPKRSRYELEMDVVIYQKQQKIFQSKLFTDVFDKRVVHHLESSLAATAVA